MRAFVAAVLGVVGLTVMGCATEVDDEIVPDPAPEAQKEPPKQALSSPLRNPQQQLIAALAANKGLESVSPERSPAKPPVPQPFKAAE